jgi:hypothetical protein
MADKILKSPEQANEELQKRRPLEDLGNALQALASAVPLFGAPIQTYLSGKLSERQVNRIHETIDALVHDLTATQRKLNTEFLKSEDFEELISEVMPRIAKERKNEKRRLYRNILLGAALSDDIAPYDIAMKYLKTVDDLEPVHIDVLRAVSCKPPEQELWRLSDSSGSIAQTLEKRLPDVRRSDFHDLLDDLNTARVTKFNLEHIGTMMSGMGAANLNTRVTDYGERFIHFVLNG